ncbi:MAG: tRNA (N6-threonylcarbamoyladenosine(37)-N6)-methyltransferase TrmO [Clostridia bacterium]|nr:tRNA (N6-threonylcarbamoyladenosine(37)-N6)-methyltransferase TrmO [Clostridia bacterium]
MHDTHELKIIACIRNDFPTKFGIPRQSGLTNLESKIVFEPEYRREEAFRGIEGYSHLWLIWEFSEARRENWSPTVRPPRLGGNRRMGVFATRSPFRPNPIGLSSVRLLGVETTEEGPVLRVTGADLMDGTPIYDIKPYLPYTDSHPDAIGGFADEKKDYRLAVVFPEDLLEKVAESKREALLELLAGDPRPQYIQDPNRLFGFEFAGVEIRFTVENKTLTVREAEPK